MDKFAELSQQVIVPARGLITRTSSPASQFSFVLDRVIEDNRAIKPPAPKNH